MSGFIANEYTATPCSPVALRGIDVGELRWIPRIEPLKRRSNAFTPAVILFVACVRRKTRPAGVTEIPLTLLPRLCPFCGNRTIIGHGRRLKQAHDEWHHEQV